MITILHRGGHGQKITVLHREGGATETPKSDYVIYGWPLICHAVQLVQFFTIQFHPFWTTDFHCPHPVTFLHGVVGGWVETYRVDDKAALKYNVIWEQEKWHTQSHKMCFSMQCNDDMLWNQLTQLMHFLYKQSYLEEVVCLGVASWWCPSQ